MRRRLATPLHLIALATLVLVALGCAAVGSERPAEPEIGPDVVGAWNERVLAIADAEDGFLTLKGLRTAAMMHLAMHDALVAIDGRFAPYLEVDPAPDADPLTAVATAAHTVAVDQYPDRRATLDAELARWGDSVPDGLSKTAGAALGEARGRALLAAREGDGWDAEAQYTWHPMGPGVYAEFEEHSGTPKGFVFGAGWAVARPFFLDRSVPASGAPNMRPPSTRSRSSAASTARPGRRTRAISRCGGRTSSSGPTTASPAGSPSRRSSTSSRRPGSSLSSKGGSTTPT